MNRDFFIDSTSDQGDAYHAGILFLNGAGFWDRLDGLDALVANPGKIVAAPINYRDHIAEVNADQQINPGKVDTDISEYGLFLKANSSLCGPNEFLLLPIPGRRTDPEVELTVVIGHAPAPRALEAGDRIDVSIERIGAMSVTIADSVP